MSQWVRILERELQQTPELVMVSLIAVQGSAPREVGARMLVTADRTFLTIGGGNLEYRAIEIARQMLRDRGGQMEQQFSLGASLGQCCGGAVKLLFERIASVRLAWIEAALGVLDSGKPALLVKQLEDSGPRMLVDGRDGSGSPALRHAVARFIDSGEQSCVQSIREAQGSETRYLFELVEPPAMNVYLFGAGHVGQALVQVLSLQDCHIHWIDTRDDPFPDPGAYANVTMISTDTPRAEICAAAEQSYFIVLTHDHALDLELSEEVLRRDDFAYFGLIGSQSKRKRFEHRMHNHGFDSARIERMTCPIGIDGIRSKQPGAIALAVAAQMMQIFEARQHASLPDIKTINSARVSYAAN